jgi:hypothetical protein
MMAIPGAWIKLMRHRSCIALCTLFEELDIGVPGSDVPGQLLEPPNFKVLFHEDAAGDRSSDGATVSASTGFLYGAGGVFLTPMKLPITNTFVNARVLR